MECAYSWHFFIFSLGSCRVVKQSFVLLNPNDFYRNECTSVCPHLNHTFFIKLEPGFEPSDAFLIPGVSLTAHCEIMGKWEPEVQIEYAHSIPGRSEPLPISRYPRGRRPREDE